MTESDGAVRRILLSTVVLVTATLAASTTHAGATTARFSTLRPGSSLPSDATCAARVRATSESRPDNATANATVPSPGSFHLTPLDDQVGYDNRTQTLEARVTGNFTGTTDEIIQWASCKWGFDEDRVRAIAATESWWHQSQLGDYTSNPSLCAAGYTVPCPRSFGIHQVTWTSDPVGTFPASRDSTAFNLDASLLVHRICYEGYMWWLRDIGYASYAAGDEWGCVGQWYSGNWHDQAAQTYITKVKGYLSTKPWTLASFSGASTTPSTVPATTTTTTVAPPPTTVPTCPCIRSDFEDGTAQGWYPGWGPVAVANTSALANTGSHALALTLSPTGPDWPAVQLSAPAGLAAGQRVTYAVYQPAGATLSSVQPYVADLNWNDVSVPAVRLVTGWNQVSWTVPAVSGIKGIGLMLNDDTGWRGQITLDSVRW
jgi:autotransporter family porin